MRKNGMLETADVVIIGGGVMGASMAFYLAQRRAGRIILLERVGLATGTTGHSGAICRQHYSNPFTIRMARDSLRVFEHFDEVIGGDAGFRRTGLLLIVGQRDLERLRANVALQQAEGVPTRLIAPDEIAEVAPGLIGEGAALACFEEDAGVVDPVLTVFAFARRARELGAELREGVAVTRVLTQGGRVRGVSTTQGEIECPRVICAANIWSVALAREVGIDLPLRPVRVPMVSLRRPADFPGGSGLHPVCLDGVNDVYLRPDLNGWTHAGPLQEDMVSEIDPDHCAGPTPQEARQFQERAARRAPVLARALLRGGWSGIYDVCVPDGHYILDEAPQLAGFYLAVGFSGHGFKMAPEVGRMMGGLVAEGERDPLLHHFRYSRFAEGDLIRPAYEYSVLG